LKFLLIASYVPKDTQDVFTEERIDFVLVKYISPSGIRSWCHSTEHSWNWRWHLRSRSILAAAAHLSKLLKGHRMYNKT